jgi:hypothetical protein
MYHKSGDGASIVVLERQREAAWYIGSLCPIVVEIWTSNTRIVQMCSLSVPP